MLYIWYQRDPYVDAVPQGTLTRLLAVLCIWHQRDPYVDAVPQGTCTPTRFPLDHLEPTMPALGCPMMHAWLGSNRREIYTPLR